MEEQNPYNPQNPQNEGNPNPQNPINPAPQNPYNPYNPQNPYGQPTPGNPFGGPMELPNATAVLVLGIISLVMMLLCCGLIGLILAIIAVVMGSSAKKLYATSPDKYTQSSYSNVKIGFIMGCVSIGLNIVSIIVLIIAIAMDALK